MYDEKTFDTLVTRVGELRKSSHTKAVAFLGVNAATFLNKKVSESRSDEKRLFVQARNLVLSYRDGLKSGDLEVEDIKDLMSDLRSAETAYNERKFAVKEKAGERQSEERSPEESQYIGPAKKTYDSGHGAEEIFGKYEHFKTKIPSDTNKHFVVILMPILVICRGIPDIIKLRKSGECTDLLFGYPILNEQILFGMNFKWLGENYAKKGGAIDYDAVAEMFASELKHRDGKRYIRIAPPHKYGKLMWMWMANERALGRLNGATGAGTFSVSNWTLPFESELKSTENNPQVKP